MNKKEPEHSTKAYGYDYLTSIQYAINTLLGNLGQAGVAIEEGTIHVTYKTGFAEAWFEPNGE